MNDEFNALAQASVEDIDARFTSLVAKSRKQPLEKIVPIAEGRVWAGGTARQLGLVDQFGGLPDALAAAAKLAKIDGDYHAKYFEKEPSEFSKLLVGLFGPDEADSTAAAPPAWFGLAALQRDHTGTRLLTYQSERPRHGTAPAPR